MRAVPAQIGCGRQLHCAGMRWIPNRVGIRCKITRKQQIERGESNLQTKEQQSVGSPIPRQSLIRRHPLGSKFKCLDIHVVIHKAPSVCFVCMHSLSSFLLHLICFPFFVFRLPSPFAQCCSAVSIVNAHSKWDVA